MSTICSIYTILLLKYLVIPFNMGKSNKMSRVCLKKNRPKRISQIGRKKTPRISREDKSFEELKLHLGGDLEVQMQNLEIEKEKGKQIITQERNQEVSKYIGKCGLHNEKTMAETISKTSAKRLSKGKRIRLEKKKRVLRKKGVDVPIMKDVSESMVDIQDAIKTTKGPNKKRGPNPIDDIDVFQNINSMKSFQESPLSTIKEHITTSAILKDKEEQNKRFLLNYRENIMKALPNL